MNNSDWIFRYARADEAAAMADFMQRNFLLTYGNTSTPENVAITIETNYGVSAQEKDLADPEVINLLAIHAEQIIGLSQLRKISSLGEGGEITRFYVAPEWQGRGLAQSMMEESKIIGRQFGAKALLLSASKAAAQAIRFYEKCGFVIAGETVFIMGDDPKPDWIMRLELA